MTLPSLSVTEPVVSGRALAIAVHLSFPRRQSITTTVPAHGSFVESCSARQENRLVAFPLVRRKSVDQSFDSSVVIL